MTKRRKECARNGIKTTEKSVHLYLTAMPLKICMRKESLYLEGQEEKEAKQERMMKPSSTVYMWQADL